MAEEWREILGFDVLYEVSNLGRVRTRHDGKKGYTKEYRFVNPTDNGKGYMRFNWKTGGKHRTVYIHRLVAELFVENPMNYSEINHKDENKSNNKADNLEWCAHLYNCNYGTRNKRTSEKRSYPVLCVETGEIFKSLDDAAAVYGVVKNAILNCIKGRSKSSGGYTWRRADVDSCRLL